MLLCEETICRGCQTRSLQGRPSLNGLEQPEPRSKPVSSGLRDPARAARTPAWSPNPGAPAAAATPGDATAAGCISPRPQALARPSAHGTGRRLGHVRAGASASANGRQPQRVLSAEPGRGVPIKGAGGGGARPRLEPSLRELLAAGALPPCCLGAPSTWSLSPSLNPSRSW